MSLSSGPVATTDDRDHQGASQAHAPGAGAVARNGGPAAPEASAARFVLVGPAPPYRGGIAQFQSALANGLRRQGIAVSQVSFTRQYPSVLFPGPMKHI